MLRRWAAPSATAAGLLLAVVAVAAWDPHRAGSWGYCPLLLVTGRPCPGCGSLRAVHDLAHGHLEAAISSNLLAVLVLGASVLLLGRWFWRRGADPDAPLLHLDAVAVAAGSAVLVAFGLLRLLPPFSWFLP